ncbi:chain length determinant protein EpsF [Aquabacterium sp.]|uniref:chain length determinant protein EpsF n=1 Tax=Aquabacterium sp. TaxID=1872578 RepID=UPI003783BAAB
MTLTQFFSILRARWLTGLLILAAVVGLTAVASLVWPKRYTAVASVVVDVKPDPVSAVMYPGLNSPAFMATQVDIIQSDRVAQHVVRSLKLADNPQVRQQWLSETGGEGTVEQWLGDSFQQNMDVKPARESSVISISYKAPDPRFAAALANAFVQAYIDVSLELRVDPARQFSSFFDGRLKAARENLEQAQARLSAFQRDKGIIATDERLDIENARLNELNTQLVALQAVSSESRSREAQAQGASSDRTQEVLGNALIGSMKAELARSEARLQELGARYGDNHPQVIEAKASIAEQRARLDAEIKRVSAGIGVTSTINRQREAQTRAELEAQRAKVLRMKQVRDEGAVIARDVENAQRIYDSLQVRYSQSNLESQTTQGNINVLTPAVPPIKASSPRLVLNLLVALFLGTLLAIGACVLLEFRNRRVRSTTDITEALGLSVLGVLPRPKSKLAIGRHGVSMQQRVVGGLTGPASAGRS